MSISERTKHEHSGEYAAEEEATLSERAEALHLCTDPPLAPGISALAIPPVFTAPSLVLHRSILELELGESKTLIEMAFFDKVSAHLAIVSSRQLLGQERAMLREERHNFGVTCDKLFCHQKEMAQRTVDDERTTLHVAKYVRALDKERAALDKYDVSASCVACSRAISLLHKEMSLNRENAKREAAELASRSGQLERATLDGRLDGGRTKQLIDTIAARGHAQLLLARLSALAPIAAQRGNTTNSNQQIISLNAFARAHYRRTIGTRGGAQASAAD
ncbi:hypothetical protein T492DRAFT_868411 [Pavlovales sp. CCMP2436]|nr:hypothetical protein T492DRAFT_868411 [Pavlovales sp. CCMP2436]